MSALTQLDADGRDISAYMAVVAASQYDEAGRIQGVVKQAWPFTQMQINAGERFVLGDGQFDWMTNQAPCWVEIVDGAPILRPRPILKSTFDRAKLPVDEEAILPDVPACTVAITGPWRGEHEHGGGDLQVGFSVPGIYTLTLEAFPYMPVSYTLTVEVQS